MISFKRIHYLAFTYYPFLCCKKCTSSNVQFCSLIILAPCYCFILLNDQEEEAERVKDMCTINCLI